MIMDFDSPSPLPNDIVFPSEFCPYQAPDDDEDNVSTPPLIKTEPEPEPLKTISHFLPNASIINGEISTPLQLLTHALRPLKRKSKNPFGHPPPVSKDRHSYRGGMKYRSRVRKRLSKPIAGELIREARLALLAASQEQQVRREASFAVLNGSFIQHQLRQKTIYTDMTDSESEDDVENKERDLWLKKVEKAIKGLGTAAELLGQDEEKGMQIIKKVSQQVGQFARTLRDGNCDGISAQLLTRSLGRGDKQNGKEYHIEEGARRTALYRTYSTLWAWRLHKVYKNQPPKHQTKSIEGHNVSKRLLERFNNDTERLSCISCSHRHPFSSLNSKLFSKFLTKVLKHSCDTQVQLLLDVMYEPDEGTARRLIRQYGSARKTVRLSTRYDVHGFLEDDDNEPLIGRVLRETFGEDMERARQSPFRKFATLGKGKGILELNLDERIRAFEKIVKSIGDDKADVEEKERLQIIWRLLQEVCLIVRDKGEQFNNRNQDERQDINSFNSMEIVEKLLEEDASFEFGKVALRRLAVESIEDTCSRCSYLSTEEVRLLKKFAQKLMLVGSPKE